MLSFLKKQSASETTTDNDALKSVTQNLYKQNLELAVKNKTLSLLRQLYQISILALDPEPLGQKVVQTVRETLEFELVGIMTLDAAGKNLSPLAFAFSDRVTKIENRSKKSFNCVIPNVDTSFFLSPIVAGKKVRHTSNIKDIWGDCLSSEDIATFVGDGHIKTSSAYPLIIADKTVAILILSFNRTYESLSTYESDAIASLVEVIALALDKSLLYKKLETTNLDLERANVQQEGLIHFISHEIKGYLAKSEAAFASIIEGDYDPITPELKVMSTTALNDNKKGVQTVLDILRASNLKKGTMDYTMQVFDLKSIVSDGANQLAKMATDKGLKFDLSIDQSQQYMINGDSGQLSDHVIRNLIDNSIKYTPTGWIRVELKKDKDRVIFSVSDSGIGLTDDDMSRLFTEGGRGKDSTKVNVNSTGYGLYIAKKIVEAHNGTITPKSDGRNKGSTFIVEFPAVQGS